MLNFDVTPGFFLRFEPLAAGHARGVRTVRETDRHR